MKQCYETERLLLLPAAQPQAQMVADYYCRNKAFFEPFDPQREPNFFTAEYQRRLLVQDEENRERAVGFRFYIVRKEQPEQIIGMVAAQQRGVGQLLLLFFGV